jgi:hypothetical protein
MKSEATIISISIVLAATIIAASIHYSIGPQRQAVPPHIKAGRFAEDLYPKLSRLDRASVLSAITDIKHQPLIAQMCKEKTGYNIDTAKPLGIFVVSGEGGKDEIHIGYAVTLGDGTSNEVVLSFDQDRYGRFYMETSPKIFLP